MGRRWFPLAVALLAATSARAEGAGEEIAFHRPEAWAMQYFAAATTFTPLAAPAWREPWSVDLAVEAGWLPSLSEDQQRVGFNGTKEEDLDKLPAVGRPRLAVGLPAGFAAELGWVPPLEVNGVTANLVALAVERPLAVRETWSLGLRAWGQVGDVESDFTCPEEAASQAPGSDGNPYGCEAPSHDTATLDLAGLAVTGGVRLGRGQLHWGAGATYNDLEFQVDAVTYGYHDRALLLTDGWTAWAAVGAGWLVGERLWLGGEVFYSPLEVVRPPSTASENDALLNARVLLRYHAR